jgi:hypothetical protein
MDEDDLRCDWAGCKDDGAILFSAGKFGGHRFFCYHHMMMIAFQFNALCKKHKEMYGDGN